MTATGNSRTVMFSFLVFVNVRQYPVFDARVFGEEHRERDPSRENFTTCHRLQLLLISYDQSSQCLRMPRE